jgi:hypothetical protein
MTQYETTQQLDIRSCPLCQGIINWHDLPPTLWLFNIAMGNGPFIDALPALPIKNGDFPWLC